MFMVSLYHNYEEKHFAAMIVLCSVMVVMPRNAEIEPKIDAVYHQNMRLNLPKYGECV